MARTRDITDKLSFDENPVIKIKGTEIEVQSDAKTMLEIMGIFKEESEAEAVIKAYSKLFTEADRKKLEKMKLPFKDLVKVIEAAMSLVQGDDEQQGEQ